MGPGIAAEQERALADAERRHLTVVFCDLVQSTALSEQLDPEDLVELIAAYHDAAARVIERFHGHVAQYQGDGVLAYFGYPHAQGDDTVHAVRAGLDLVRAVHELSGPPLDGGEVRLAARVGIHTGVVVVSEMGAGGQRHSQAVGDTVNMAARLEKLADPGRVVVSAATERVTRGYFVFTSMGTVRLSGIADPVTVYGVADDTGIRTRLALAAATGLTPLVGREQELKTMEERWQLAREGTGQAVLVSGEPGIGKSRLVHELGRRVGDETTRLVFQASPYYASSALHPVVEELERVFLIDGKGADENNLARLTDALELQGVSVDEARPALASLLSIAEPSGSGTPQVAPQEQKRQTFAALTAVMAAETRLRPVLVVFEDIHWADPSTLELLGLLLAEAPTQRILIVMTARPEFEPPWPAETMFAKLSPARLEGGEVEELMAAVLGERSLPRRVRAEVAERAAGVPLFIEETLKMILESGPGDAPAIPGTLQNPLTARLDGLGDMKELAQLASVAALGGEFSFELLRAVTDADDETLREGLDELVRAELLYERGTLPDPAYVFKHALIREAAYGSLLRSARRRFHARIAQVLEEAFPERVKNEPEVIAQHLSEAGRTLEAIRYWHQAGERALRSWATGEAVTHFERGLGLMASLPEGQETRELELAFQLGRGAALMAARGYAAPEAEAAYARAEALSGAVADPSRLAPALYGLGAFYASTGQPLKAFECGRRLHGVADALGDADVLMEANVMLGIAQYLRGNPAAAERLFEHVLARWEPEKHRDHIFAYGQEPGVVSLAMTALTRGWLGRLDEALEFAGEAELRGREVAHPLTFAYTLAAIGIVYQLVGDVERAEGTARELVTVTSEHALPMWLAWGRTMRGWALLERGRAEEGMAEITVGMAGAEVAHSSVMKIHFLSQLAAVFGRLGYVNEGITLVEEGFADLEPTDERVSEAELHRSRGLLHLAGKRESVAAEACFRRGIEVARGQQALLLELRSATALAGLLAGEERAEEARVLLEAVTGRFTQGFGTPVLQNASDLLERVGGARG
ncbi:MAG TPA: adenylate/guanylate cyclase domain-containing protein [Gaiellaceae bacterium]|nr:adenylate/guanylate cyclase domain-containing protein [Gaiellaceae bacterium]